METLEIESTERTPGIKFDYDHHYFEINGEAYPENSDEFFRPIMESLQEYSGLGSSETAASVTDSGSGTSVTDSGSDASGAGDGAPDRTKLVLVSSL